MIAQKIRELIKSININSDINIIIDGENSLYQIISSLKMNENIDKNISIIDFGQCEKILKEEYGIDYLLVFKIDTKIGNNSPIIVNYEVYDPNTLIKLNLKLCENVKINTYTNFFLQESSLEQFIQLNESGYDMYNINDSFYQDLCSPFITLFGTDILLGDRKNDYYENISLCEGSCIYSKYDYITYRIKCECQVKNELKISNEIDEDNFLQKFVDLDDFSNIKVLKCFKLVFSKKGQTHNIGSYFYLIIIFC